MNDIFDQDDRSARDYREDWAETTGTAIEATLNDKGVYVISGYIDLLNPLAITAATFRALMAASRRCIFKDEKNTWRITVTCEYARPPKEEIALLDGWLKQ